MQLTKIFKLYTEYNVSFVENQGQLQGHLVAQTTATEEVTGQMQQS